MAYFCPRPPWSLKYGSPFPPKMTCEQLLKIQLLEIFQAFSYHCFIVVSNISYHMPWMGFHRNNWAVKSVSGRLVFIDTNTGLLYVIPLPPHNIKHCGAIYNIYLIKMTYMYWKYYCLKIIKMGYGAQFILDTNDKKWCMWIVLNDINTDPWGTWLVLLDCSWRFVHLLIV